jgi:hypothetical protein
MNITNIINLSRAYFIENKKTLLIQCLCVFGIGVIGFSISGMPEITPFIGHFVLLIVASRFFQSYLKKNNTTHFFTIPATSFEKFIHAIIMLIIVGIIFQILMFAGACIGHYSILPLFRTEINTHGFSFLGIIIMDCKGYLYLVVALSVFLFGSIYFKNKTLIKTFCVGFGLFFGTAMLFLILLRIIFFDLRNIDTELFNSININLAPIFEANHYYIIPIVLIVFFLSLTYLRLKETEV